VRLLVGLMMWVGKRATEFSWKNKQSFASLQRGVVQYSRYRFIAGSAAKMQKLLVRCLQRPLEVSGSNQKAVDSFLRCRNFDYLPKKAVVVFARHAMLGVSSLPLQRSVVH